MVYVKNPIKVPYFAHGVSVWHHNPENNLFSGTSSDSPVEEFVDSVERYGHAIVVVDRKRPFHHNMIGSGVGHNDAEFVERGRSMAAYYENGETHDGLRWWEAEAKYIRQHYYPEEMALALSMMERI